MKTAPEHQLDVFPELMIENELVEFLRIPEVSNGQDHANVVKNLKRIVICHVFTYAVSRCTRERQFDGGFRNRLKRDNVDDLGFYIRNAAVYTVASPVWPADSSERR